MLWNSRVDKEEVPFLKKYVWEKKFKNKNFLLRNMITAEIGIMLWNEYFSSERNPWPWRKLRYQISCICVRMLSCFSRVQPFGTLWPVAYQVPLSMGFSRQEYWNGLPFLLPWDLPNPGLKPASLMSPALACGFFTLAPPGKTMDHLL